MSKKKKQRPAAKLRDGTLSATIWRNESENGAFFSVNFGRLYTDDNDELQDSDSFSGSELLRIAHLATKAYDRARELAKAEIAKDEDED